MINGKSVLALIPARAGSKRLHGKNVKMLGGKPLIQWTMDAAFKSKFIDRIVVSTDDEEIWRSIRWPMLNISSVPTASLLLRPSELATDDADIADVVIHALEARPKFDWLVLLQPTSPLRFTKDIDASIELAQPNYGAMSVAIAKNHPFWTFSIINGRFASIGLRTNITNITNRQELPIAYAPNGAVYVTPVDAFKETRSFCTKITLPYIMPAERSVDIDTKEDFWLAQRYLSKRLDWDG